MSGRYNSVMCCRGSAPVQVQTEPPSTDSGATGGPRGLHELLNETSVFQMRQVSVQCAAAEPEGSNHTEVRTTSSRREFGRGWYSPPGIPRLLRMEIMFYPMNKEGVLTQMAG